MLGEMMKNANIGLAVGLAILFIGGFPLRHSEVALQLIMLITLIAAFGTCLLLDERDERRERNRDQ